MKDNVILFMSTILTIFLIGVITFQVNNLMEKVKKIEVEMKEKVNIITMREYANRIKAEADKSYKYNKDKDKK